MSDKKDFRIQFVAPSGHGMAKILRGVSEADARDALLVEMAKHMKSWDVVEVQGDTADLRKSLAEPAPDSGFRSLTRKDVHAALTMVCADHGIADPLFDKLYDGMVAELFA